MRLRRLNSPNQDPRKGSANETPTQPTTAARGRCHLRPIRPSAHHEAGIPRKTLPWGWLAFLSRRPERLGHHRPTGLGRPDRDSRELESVRMSAIRICSACLRASPESAVLRISRCWSRLPAVAADQHRKCSGLRPQVRQSMYVLHTQHIHGLPIPVKGLGGPVNSYRKAPAGTKRPHWRIEFRAQTRLHLMPNR